jgi:predicted transcriptional regulator
LLFGMASLPFSLYLYDITRYPLIKNHTNPDFNIGNSNDIHQSIKDYVHYYNNERFSYALKYKTPAEFKSPLGFN